MIGAIIYAALAADSTLAALVSTRIYPETAPDEADLPLVVYTVRAGESIEGSAAMRPCTITANCYAESDSDAESVGNAVRDVLDEFDGSDADYLVRGLYLSDYGELRDPDVAIWGRLATFSGWIVRR